MNRLSIVLILSILVGCIAGCADEGSQHANELEGSTYTGVIPCADCEGIAYNLSLKNDNRFESSLMYVGESNRTFTERGSWEFETDSMIVLNAGEESSRKFKVKNERLVMLNRQGDEIEGNLAAMYVLSKADSAGADQKWKQRREKGIDFRAAGNEPSWSLDIDFDRMISFKTLKGDSITTPVPKMQQDTSSKARVLNAETESGSLNVQLYPTGCVDDMSGEVFSHRVKVSSGAQSYSGCGNFINPKYKLNDFWTLHELNGSTISPKDTMRQMPALQFDVSNEKVYGNTGCNRLNGSVSLKDSSLAFSKMVTTKMACPGSDIESQFTDALQQVETYDINNAELLLMNQNDTLMILRRRE